MMHPSAGTSATVADREPQVAVGALDAFPWSPGETAFSTSGALAREAEDTWSHAVNSACSNGAVARHLRELLIQACAVPHALGATLCLLEGSPARTTAQVSCGREDDTPRFTLSKDVWQLPEPLMRGGFESSTTAIGAPKLIPCDGREAAVVSDAAPLDARGVRAVFLVPVTRDGGVIAVLALRLSRRRTPARAGVAMLRGLADQAVAVLSLAQSVGQARMEGALRERERVAREIHDGITQTFIGIKMLLSREPRQEGGAIDSAHSLAQQGLDEVRRAVKALRPSHLTSRPLDRAIGAMAAAVIPPGIALQIDSVGDWNRVSGDVEANLFRIVQEAVNNAIKHSHGKQITIELSCGPREAVILVEDDGHGLSSRPPQREGGFGMTSMRQRAASIGARLDVASCPGVGTQVYVSVPLER